MPAYMSKGDIVYYIAYTGIKSSIIDRSAPLESRIFHHLKNGEYVIDMHFGILKTNGTFNLGEESKDS